MAADAVSTAAAAKEKTKAKQRYLKRKKERRKHRKSTTGPQPVPKKSQNAESSGSEEEEESANEEEEPLELEVVQVDPEEEERDRRKKEKREKRAKRRENKAVEDVDAGEREDEEEEDSRPRKRRRLSSDDEEPVEHPEPVVIEPTHARSPTPQVALPSFPLPALPDAPSKRDLALQGLDQAVAGAEVVDPSLVLSIPAEGEDAGEMWLSERMRKRLRDLGINELFAVQTALLPFLLPKAAENRRLYQPYNPPRDVCVSAPTGSGKTLAYVVPIVEILSARIVTRLRALIVLPTRDLVTQVRETFEAVGKGRRLKIGIATGQHSFAHEQAQLVADRTSSLQGGSSRVDILICTPGRLMDHVNGTPNFSLQHLRFLVIDEADRLLAQSFQDWLAQVLSATRPRDASTRPGTSLTSPYPYPDALSPSFLHPSPRTDLDEKKSTSCQKLLFSATLTSDPGKISKLELRDAKYFVVGAAEGKAEDGLAEVGLGLGGERFNMPATLAEHMIICTSSQKPLTLFHLVHSQDVTNALVFTKSAESTFRLVRLFEFFEEARAKNSKNGQESQKKITIAAYSSDLPAGERKSALEKFKAKEIDILVASDLISRGIDISHVAHVVSYDVPVDMRKYVHRVGRTARAGRKGDAWTLVEEQEARFFKSMLKAADHLDKVKRMRVGEKDVEPLTAFYETALGQLQKAYTRHSGSSDDHADTLSGAR